MEKYLKNYDSLEKKIVYDFKLNNGGIGDNIKFFMHLLNLCIKYNIKIHYLRNDINTEKYLKLKYEKMYITNQELTNHCEIKNKNDLSNLDKKIFYTITPYALYSGFSYDDLQIPIEKVFYFSDEIKLNCNHMLPTYFEYKNEQYISIHLRLGDSYMKQPPNYTCWDEKREFNEEKMFDFIEVLYHQNKTIIFFCDNHEYKLKIKSKYPNIIITYSDIGHTSFHITTDKQFLDTISELYLMSNSQSIVAVSNSGFSIIASKFKQIPIYSLYS
jgi:hypothetical protein